MRGDGTERWNSQLGDSLANKERERITIPEHIESSIRVQVVLFHDQRVKETIRGMLEGSQN